jgi:hypothetical protein
MLIPPRVSRPNDPNKKSEKRGKKRAGNEPESILSM